MKPSKEALIAARKTRDATMEERLQAAYAIDFAQLEQQLREAQKELSKQHISELEQSLSTLREQLRLANIDQANAEAEVSTLREENARLKKSLTLKELPDYSYREELRTAAIVEQSKEIDQLRAELEEAKRENMTLDFQFNDLKSKVDEIVSQEKYQLEKDLDEARGLLAGWMSQCRHLSTLGPLRDGTRAFLSRRKKEG